MKTYKVTDINYDTDGQKVALPSELTINLDDDADPGEELADKVSDITGYCVNSLQFVET